MADGKSGTSGGGNSGNEGDPLFANPIDLVALAGDGDSGGSNGGNGGSATDANGDKFDPALHVHPDKRNADGSFRKRKGRGSSGSKSKAKNHSDLNTSAQMLAVGLVMMHDIISAATKTPELVLSEGEAVNLSKSGLAFLAEFDVAPNPKVMAGIIFAGNVASVYGTRFAAIKVRKAQEKKEKEPGVAGVYNADGNPMGTTDYSGVFADNNPGMGGLTN